VDFWLPAFFYLGLLQFLSFLFLAGSFFLVFLLLILDAEPFEMALRLLLI
jgi:hypothetical protein